MNKEIIISLCAGEASGDLLGAHLMEALKQQYSHIRFVGIGGPRMKAAGLISVDEQEPLAVRGYVEVLGSLPEILKIRCHLIDELKRISPHVFVGIDAPNFNLPVAAKLKEAGIPTLHYVSPSVWAWKPERVYKIVRQVNKVLCLFPMEPQFYRQAGGQAEYVGHPLAQMLPMENSREAVRERLKLGLTTPVFALLPGSRVSEVDYMAPVFLRAAALIVRDLPESVFLMPYPSAAVRERLQTFLKQAEFQNLPIRLQAAKAELAYMAADVVLVTSGTAALEVALCKRPMVISYKISPLTYALVKRKIKIPYVGLPNILLNKMVVPELLQHDATPEKLAAAVLDWYYHPARVGELEQQFMQLHQRLKRNTDELAAYAVLTEAGLRLPKPIAQGEAEDMLPVMVESEKTETVEIVNTQRDNEPVIPPPSIVLGNQMSAVNHSRQPETISPIHTVREITGQVEPTTHQKINNHNELDDMNPNKVKRKSGLFGWLLSLFSRKSVPTQPETLEPQQPIADSDSTVVVVARAEEADTIKPVKSSETEPNRLVIEEEELPSAAPQMSLPKSSVLVSSKPNIFDKYRTEATQPQQPQQPESSQNQVNQSGEALVSVSDDASISPSIQVQAVSQPALKVKVTAVMRKSEEETHTITPSDNQTVVVESVASTVAPNPEPTTAPTTTDNAVSPPVGAVAQYINQATMAWLPDSVMKSSQTQTETPISVETVSVPVNNPITNEEVTVDVTSLMTMPVVASTSTNVKDVVQIDNYTPAQSTEPPSTLQIVVDSPKVVTKPTPSITIQVAPKVKTQPETTVTNVESVVETVAPLLDVKVPEVNVQAVTSTPVPVVPTAVEKLVETAEPIMVPMAELEKAQAAAAVDNVHNSFASVFRRHTLQKEQADYEDESHNVAETESDTPNQIIVNRSEAMSAMPTPATKPTEVNDEDGLSAPRVSNYSSNPNRYNSGIFF